MIGDSFEERIEATGHFIFDKMRDQKSLFYSLGSWQEKALNWAKENQIFEAKLIQFIDVLPVLKDEQQVIEHIQAYFDLEDKDCAAFLKMAAGTAGISSITAKLASKSIKKNIELMAKHFLLGETAEEASTNAAELWSKHNIAVTLLNLGSSSQEKYIELLQKFSEANKNWHENPILEDTDYGKKPRTNLLVKTSSLYSQFGPLNWQESLEKTLEKLRPIIRQAKALNSSITFAAETESNRELSLEVIKTLLNEDEFKNCEQIAITVQAYSKASEENLKKLIKWLKKRRAPITIRLIKGEHLDHETRTYLKNNWPNPLFTNKAQVDANFEKLTRIILENRRLTRPQIKTTNVRQIAFAIELAKEMEIPRNAISFETIHGLAEPTQKVLTALGYRVEQLAPVGPISASMTNLAKRLHKLAQYGEEANQSELLQDPSTLEEAANEGSETTFQNEAPFDFSKHEVREKFANTIKSMRTKYFGRKFGLIIDGKEISTDEWNQSTNPAKPEEIVGTVAIANTELAEQAIQSSKQAFESWSILPASQRIAYLKEIASILHRRKYELSAILVCEAGKNWQEADGEVVESIDFCNYYAEQMQSLSKPKITCNLPGQQNEYSYQAKGVGAIISPWNFPLATPVNLIATSIVAGNAVVFKPASNTPVIAAHLINILKEAKLPDGVVNFVPGPGNIIGDYLVNHKDINFIAFTGSLEIGHKIMNSAQELQEEQRHFKTVIAEMGGKNAIIIDETADLDAAIEAVINAAFGFQGQKCSACSRVVVLDGVYEEFINKLEKAVKELNFGNPEKPQNTFGPLISKEQQAQVLKHIEKAKEEAELLVELSINENGNYVPFTIFKNVESKHETAQEEIFGPLLSIIKASSLDEAIQILNDTKFGLTGGIFSRNPFNIQRAKQYCQVGNFYVNSSITGGRVGRNPFGGVKMSGIGSKFAGPDYLLQFLSQRSNNENTIRANFSC